MELVCGGVDCATRSQETAVRIRGSKGSTKVRHRGVAALAVMLGAGASDAWAFPVDTGNPDLQIRWDNTIKYSMAWRLKNPSGALTDSSSTLNHDDGDRNFDKGLISNRIDLFSEMDLSYKGFGARVSGAAWFDGAYNRSNDNQSPGTANAQSVPYNEFTSDTQKLHGHKAELMDAFVFGRADLGEARSSFRIGRHALLWGESLFLGDNGIAGGQAPVDAVKAASVPNTPFRELIRPTPQVSGQVQINSDVSVGAYYQWGWDKTRLAASGSYFSTVDMIGEGAERLIVGGPLMPGGGSAAYFNRGDMDARDSGQGGLQVRFRAVETDFGLYAIRFHAKTPTLYLRPGAADPFTGQIGQFQWVYPEDIQAYGASFSHTFGIVNLAGEMSIRRNTPLSSDAQVDVTGSADNRNNPLYAVGNSLHAQFSWIATLERSFIAEEADFSGEVGWNRRTEVTKNRSALTPRADVDAVNIRFVYEPKYHQALPGLDLSVPVGFGYGFGNSSVVGSFLGNQTGDVSIALNATYLDVWRGSLSYTHYLGKAGTFLDENNHASYQQSLKDRDFVSLTVRRTF